MEILQHHSNMEQTLPSTMCEMQKSDALPEPNHRFTCSIVTKLKLNFFPIGLFKALLSEVDLVKLSLPISNFFV